MSELVRLRKSMQTVAQQHNIKFSYMPLLIKAASLALQQFPVLNAYLDKNADNVIYKVIREDR